MKKSASKKSSAAQATSDSSAQPLVDAQPQIKTKAAVQAGMFLYIDDSWSNRYYNKGDLHFIERVLLGG